MKKILGAVFLAIAAIAIIAFAFFIGRWAGLAILGCVLVFAGIILTGLRMLMGD